MSSPSTAISLGTRFPAAHQFLRMRLFSEIFPIAPSVSCWLESIGQDRWLVRLRWPALDFAVEQEFSGVELRAIYGPWSTWARNRALDIADRLPV